MLFSFRNFVFLRSQISTFNAAANKAANKAANSIYFRWWRILSENFLSQKKTNTWFWIFCCTLAASFSHTIFMNTKFSLTLFHSKSKMHIWTCVCDDWHGKIFLLAKLNDCKCVIRSKSTLQYAYHMNVQCSLRSFTRFNVIYAIANDLTTLYLCCTIETYTI